LFPFIEVRHGTILGQSRLVSQRSHSWLRATISESQGRDLHFLIGVR
jgi:hypothetical protein